SLLSAKQEELLAREKGLLLQLHAHLAGMGGDDDGVRTISDAIAQMNEIFTCVIVGEFNSGKSTLINALLGDRFCPEGSLPTTAQIQVIKKG
ncbi:unnamed protein product, partial [Phaeothamnion confervicola]